MNASDRGSATVWSVAAIAVLCFVFGIVLALGQAVVARHRAAGGADLAALAAADDWAQGATAACERAGRVARAQEVRFGALRAPPGQIFGRDGGRRAAGLFHGRKVPGEGGPPPRLETPAPAPPPPSARSLPPTPPAAPAPTPPPPAAAP
ncbi:Rv3654c family TadE-like protein [Streptomyces lividans]|uniref:Rv3654c family TadE-like protein n=1 Tax=Streptomyces lividans TaxID=1916 RepID=UPI00056BEE16